MKSGFILVLIALGTFICSVSHAAPTSSEVQQDDDDLATSNKELLKLLDQITAKSQQDNDDDGDQDNKNTEAEIFKRLLSKRKIFHGRGILSRGESAQAEFFKKLFRKVKKGFKKIGGGLFRGVSGLLGFGGGGCRGGYKKLKEVAKLQAVVSKMQQDGDIDTANAQFYTALLGGLGKRLLGNMFGGGRCKIAKLQEYFLKTQEDDDNDDDDGSEVQAQNDNLLNELEDLTAAEQQEDDEDGDTALTEVEDQQAQDDDEDGSDAYAELQGRRRRWRGRNSRKWNRRRGPKRRRNRYRGAGRGGWSRRLGQLGGGLLSGYLGQRAYGGLGGAGGGYPPSMMPGGIGGGGGGYGYQPNMGVGRGYPPEMGAGGYPPGLGGLPADVLQQLGIGNNGAAVIENSDDDDIDDDDDGDIQAFLSSILES